MKDFIHLIQYALIYAKNYFLESLAIYFPKVVPKPLYVGFSVGTLCNFKCQHCDLWKLKTEPKEYLTTHQVKKFLGQLREWLGPFRLVFTGAEPFLRKDILEIISFAAENNIYTVLTTNGWLIDEKLAQEIALSGLDVFNLSLDGVKASTHETLRGKKGAYQRAIRALRLVKGARQDKTPVIYINTVIMEPNVDELIDLVKLAKKEGVEAIRFQALESKQLFGNEEYRSSWFENHPLWPKEVQKLTGILDKLNQLKARGYPIKNTHRELEDLKSYYQNPVKIAQKYKFCFTGVRNFAVDEYGEVKLCFGMEPVGNVLKQKPKAIWFGKKAEKKREQIRNCQRYCRILPCNKREELGQLVMAFFRKF